uniref:Prolamin-like domain-containing protein n=1 Tax=Salix viminalis TaxID=40686 RepID=A0A6N2NGA8_SALVM
MAISQSKIFLVLLKQYCTIRRAFSKLARHRLRCKLTIPCGLEIFRSFSGTNNNPSDDCCKKLVATGIDCHNTFTEILVSKEPQENSSKISLRSMDIWNLCVAMAISQSKIFLVLLCLIALAGSNTAPSGEPFPKPSKAWKVALQVDHPVWIEIFRSFSGTITTHQTIVARSSDSHIKRAPENPSKISLRSMDIWNRCVVEAMLHHRESLFPSLARHGRLRCEVDRPVWIEVFRSFSGNNNNPSDDCCKKLVATGIDCHNAFTEILISKEPQENPSKISLRSMDIWNRCVAVASKA